MAGSSMTFTYDDGYDGAGYPGSVRKVIIDFTTDDTTGAVSGTTRKIVGWLVKAVTDPSAGAAPSANWDVNLTESTEGNDILAACVSTLLNQHTSDTTVTSFHLTAGGTHPVVCDTITVSVSNGGNSKQGQIILYYVPG